MKTCATCARWTRVPGTVGGKCDANVTVWPFKDSHTVEAFGCVLHDAAPLPTKEPT